MTMSFPDWANKNPAVFDLQTSAAPSVITRAFTPDRTLESPISASAFWSEHVGDAVEAHSREPVTVRRSSSAPNIEERIFDSLVALKVMASQYAMHLSAEQQVRLFDELDFVLNVEGWNPEDQLPKVGSFQSFIRWAIYAKGFSWSSMGVSNDGNILVAWESEKAMMTADFEGGDRVRWTAKRKSDSDSDGYEYAAGDSTLKYFARQTDFYFAE